MRRLARRAGRRGAFLALLAVFDAAIGYSLLTAPAAQRTMDLLLPYPVWGWIWVAVAVVCAAGTFTLRDRFQFTAAYVLMGSQSLLSIDLWLIQHQPRGWVGVVIWATLTLIIYLAAGWPEPLRAADLPGTIPPPGP